MKIRIIVAYVPRYRRGHRWQFVPPITGIQLAALAGRDWEVEVIHEQVRPVPIDDSPDLVALSFFSGFARHAYDLAQAYRKLGVPVVGGGPHVSFWMDEALEHLDSVVVGEAETAWPRLLHDVERGKLARVYHGEPASMAGLPTPRYDLLEPHFVVPRVVQATRGCPFSCTFCSVPRLNPGFRMRPVAEVISDIAHSHFAHFWQDKVVWFWDDNLLARRPWAKQLLRELCGLNRWWLTQASIDIAEDEELLDLMAQSGCIGIFLGIESLDAAALQSVDKRHNRIHRYQQAITALQARGICVMAGFIAGFDSQDREATIAVADQIRELDVDVPFLSILTPYRGTDLYDQLLAQGRILEERDWPHYNGYNVAYEPARMTPGELLQAHRQLWQRAFGPMATAGRLARGARRLSRGGLMLSAAMNGFYGLKGLSGNLPADAPLEATGGIDHRATASQATDSRLGKDLHPGELWGRQTA
jgi:radical SAM superfamily enzyme YgiQ (UPF0313 family)